MNACNPDKLSKIFETKEQANKMASELIARFRMFECTVRKSLPEYKGHRNKTFTLYIKAATVAEELMIRKFLKEAVQEA